MFKTRIFYTYRLLITFVVFVVLCCFPSATMEVSANSTESAFSVGENLSSKSDAEMLWWNAILQQATRTIHFPFPPAFDFYRPTTGLSAMDYSKPTALDGTFMQPASLGYKIIPAYFDEIRELGMDTVIIQYIRTKEMGCIGEDCCKSDEFHWLPNFPAKLGWILDQAQENDIDVYVGLDLTSHGLCPQDFYKEPNVSLTIEDTRKTIILLVKRYGHHPALMGWYIPDEPSLSEWTQPELAYNYYAGVVQSIRRASSKAILISPHLLELELRTPVEMAYRALNFQNNTGVDIFLWQDSAGADGVNLQWNPFSRSFGDYISAISTFLGKDATWTVHEAFNCCVSSSEFIDGASYRPSSIVRLLEQIEDVKSNSVDKKIAWIQQHHFGSVDPNRHLEAVRLMDAYKAQLRLSLEYLLAESYEWIVGPDPQYGDRDHEMFNLHIGNPKDFTNDEWVGIDGKETGGAVLVIDLGEERTLKWVGFHLMSLPQVGIRYPEQLSLACESGEEFWMEMGSWVLPLDEEDTKSEYLFSNPKPLERDCRRIRVSLKGNDWIFISEIEIVAISVENDRSEEPFWKDLLFP
jgi:hypothetical protein